MWQPRCARRHRRHASHGNWMQAHIVEHTPLTHTSLSVLGYAPHALAASTQWLILRDLPHG